MINNAAQIPLPRPERQSVGPSELKRDLEFEEINENIRNLMEALNPYPNYGDGQAASPTSSKEEGQSAKAAHRESVDPGSRQANVAKQKLGSPRVRL